jgi:cupin 2 domain-containing protein
MQTVPLWKAAPTALPEEMVTILAENRHVRIERIVSTGHASPADFWYEQGQHEWVAVLCGAAELEFEDGQRVPLTPGDALLIPAGKRHRVQWTSTTEPTVWLAVFFDASDGSER